MHLSMVCPRMEGGEGGGQPTGIRLSEVHVGGEFDILNVPRVGNLTQPPSWKVENQDREIHLRKYPVVIWMSFPHF